MVRWTYSKDVILPEANVKHELKEQSRSRELVHKYVDYVALHVAHWKKQIKYDN